MPPKKKTAHQLYMADYYNKLAFEFACPFCNCQTSVSRYLAHSKKDKHLNNKEIFFRDNPDFKESIFNFKLNNLRKYLNKAEEIDDKKLNYILNTDPTTYDINELISGN